MSNNSKNPGVVNVNGAFYKNQAGVDSPTLLQRRLDAATARGDSITQVAIAAKLQALKVPEPVAQ